MSEWFSADALAKQAALAEWPEGQKPPLTMLIGLMEPRVQPTAAERCVCCSIDARDEAGGEEHVGKRWCSICVGREHHLEGDA